MQLDPLFIDELRLQFKAGATPSASIRRIAARHPEEPQIDAVVREYFRQAFGVHTVRVGPDQVRHLAAGGTLPSLNLNVLPRMVEMRREWDPSPGADPSWMDAIDATATAAIEPQALPELAASWDRLDDEAKQYVRRVIGTARTLHGNLRALAALAEQLQLVSDESRAVGVA